MGDAQRLQIVQNAAVLYKSLYALIAPTQASHLYQNENNMHPIKTRCRVFDSRGPDTRGGGNGGGLITSARGCCMFSCRCSMFLTSMVRELRLSNIDIFGRFFVRWFLLSGYLLTSVPSGQLSFKVGETVTNARNRLEGEIIKV